MGQDSIAADADLVVTAGWRSLLATLGGGEMVLKTMRTHVQLGLVLRPAVRE